MAGNENALPQDHEEDSEEQNNGGDGEQSDELLEANEEAGNDDDESDKFVSGMKESPEVVEANLQEQFESEIPQADREALRASGESARERRRGSQG